MENNLHIISLNCNSLLSLDRRNELDELIQRKKPQLVLLSETHLTARHKLCINGYTTYRVDGPKKNSGGTAILIKNGIPHFKSRAFISADTEATLVNVGLEKNFITFCSIYVRQFNKHNLMELLNCKGKIFIAGDFNAKHTSWNCHSNNPNGIKLFNLCLEANIQLHAPTEYTFPRGRSIIDLAISSNLANIGRPKTLHEFCSDHLPVSYDIKFKTNCPSVPKKILNYSKADWMAFKIDIHNKLSENITIQNSEDIEKTASLLTNAIISAIKVAVPKVDPSTLQLPSEVKDLISKRNKLRRLHYKYPDQFPKADVNMLSKLIQYTVAEIRNIKFRQRLEKIPVNSPDIFNEIRKLQGKRLSPINSIHKTPQPIIDPKEIAEEIASHYSKVHSQNSNLGDPNFDLEVNHEVKTFLENPPPDLSISPTNVTEVSYILKKLKNRKAPGDDNIPNSALKNLPERAIILLTNLINGILTFGYFPKCWKVGKVIPIPKPGKPGNAVEHTRPITLLNGLSKVTEAVALNRLQPCFDSFHPKEQFGFRAKHSSTQAVLRLKNFIKQSKRFGKSTMAVFLDIEKAFDTVWHDGLIYKMIKCNFPFYLINLINSYFKDRRFYVSINQNTSSIKDVPAGVAQGSLLGPHLYSFFYHDIPRHNENQIQIYADDTTIYTSSVSGRKSCDRIQEHLSRFSEYAKKWKIKVNSSKTELIHFFPRKNSKMPPAYPICFENNTLNFTNNVKYLGVILNDKLSVAPHIAHVRKKAFMGFNSLYPFLNRNSQLSVGNKIRVYKAYIRPLFTYAIPAWMVDMTKTDWSKLRPLQTKALRFIFNEWPRPPTYKCIRNVVLQNLANLDPIPTFALRLQQRCISNLLQNESSFLQRIPHIWDLTLPQDLEKRLLPQQDRSSTEEAV